MFILSLMFFHSCASVRTFHFPFAAPGANRCMLPSAHTLSVDTPVGCLMIDGEAVRRLMETGAFAQVPVRLQWGLGMGMGWRIFGDCTRGRPWPHIERTKMIDSR